MSDRVVLEAKSGKVAGSVLFMHGLGDQGHGWRENFANPSFRSPHIRYIFYNAPSIPVSINNGHVMPAWYDVHKDPHQFVSRVIE